jgi:hypothetical protein
MGFVEHKDLLAVTTQLDDGKDKLDGEAAGWDALLPPSDTIVID